MAVTDTAAGISGKRKVDAFVFDCVCHIFNFDPANALGGPGLMFDEHLYAFHQLLTKEGEPVMSREEFFREWSADEIYEMIIEGSDTDMIAAQPLPLTDLFHDGLSPWEKCAEMAAKHPDRAIFWGAVNPLEGKNALDLMTRQVEDHGARAFKFYNVRYDYGQPFPWRMDDPRIAYPCFERAQELGVNLIGVHKGVPLGPPGELFDEHLYAFHSLLTRQGEPILSRDEFFKEWSVDEIYDMVIEGSDTDMIVAQPLPLTDLFHDGLSAWEKCAEMAAKHPDKAVFWGSVNPLEGKKALDLMTRQVEDYGAKAFKFYNVRYDYGQPFPWRMDDPRIAFPIFEHAQKLGVNLIGVHKGVPLGPQPIEHTRTFDMDGAAANFPDINFVIFHVGLPWLDEVLWQIVRYPNLYASIAATVNFIARQPRVFAETLGKMLWWCGEDKILYGGEAPIWHPQWALEEFWNFELPRDIVEERGYPQLTEQAKRKILGGNLARLHGMEAP